MARRTNIYNFKGVFSIALFLLNIRFYMVGVLLESPLFTAQEGTKREYFSRVIFSSARKQKRPPQKLIFHCGLGFHS